MIHEVSKGQTYPSHGTEFLTVPEFCQAMRFGKTMFYDLVKQKKISTIKLGRKTLVRKSELDAFASSLAA
jgi:excisionase family DNA binding protein